VRLHGGVASGFLLWQPIPLQHFIPTQIPPYISFAIIDFPKKELIALDSNASDQGHAFSVFVHYIYI
jgi:hypothetical protein